MIKYFIAFCCLLSAVPLLSQNVGIGTSTPSSKLEVVGGGFLVRQESTIGNTAPTPAQIITMTNGTTLSFDDDDLVGRLYDPGGFFGDYAANVQDTAVIPFPSSFTAVGIQVVLEDLQLGVGDSLFIIALNSAGFAAFTWKIFTGVTGAGTYISHAGGLQVILKSNGDASTGRGFSLLFRKILPLPAQPVTNFTANHFFFDPVKRALRMNTSYTDSIGVRSVALGGSSAPGFAAVALGATGTASGAFSVSLGDARAVGDNSFATGISVAESNYSTALGMSVAGGERSFAAGSSTAFGFSSVALGSGASYSTGSVAIGVGAQAAGTNAHCYGSSSSAGGANAFAIGTNAIASSDRCFAIGNNVEAGGGFRSFALGNYVSTNGFDGCFTIGDNSTTTVMQTFVDNGFRARFAGGYRLFTNSAVTIGAFLNANANSWAALSDVRIKENFLPVDGESFLKKIAAMPQYTWNYIGQDVKTLRHYGPMAQDFYKAFGRDALGEIGCDTLINQQDFWE